MKKEKKSVWTSILLIVICTLFTATGQYFWKVGSRDIISFTSFVINLNVWLGFLFYGIGAILLLIGLRNINLSTAYPVLAASYIWVSLIGYFFLNESFYFSKGLGIGIIFSGIIILGFGSDNR